MATEQPPISESTPFDASLIAPARDVRQWDPSGNIISPWVGSLALILVAVATIALLARRRRRLQASQNSIRAELQILQASRATDRFADDDWSTLRRLTRRWAAQRAGIEVTGQTSRGLVDALFASDVPADQVERAEHFLNLADEVEFGGHRQPDVHLLDEWLHWLEGATGERGGSA